MPDKRLISLVVPVFNEEENVKPLYLAVQGIMAGLAERYDHEFVFTDNHSTDKTFAILAELAMNDPRIKVYRFSKNFGYQRSIHTGYCKCSGDAAIQLDCDMQDPPGLIPQFIELWEKGHQVVYGVRRSRKEAWHLNQLRKLFYRLIAFLSEDPLPVDAGDFRLVDRVVLDELRRLDDIQPYLRGTIAALGFSQIGVPYDRVERARGNSKFSWKDLVNLSIDGLLNHSIIPLRIATLVGLMVSLVTFFALFGYIAGKFIFGQNWPAGFATTTILILLSLSLNALFLGIIGEYLGRIYKQVKKKPTVVIEKIIPPMKM